jgi:hypothetical protein
VYSFGVILLQLISARPAVDSAENPSNQHIIDWVSNANDASSTVVYCGSVHENCLKHL